MFMGTCLKRHGGFFSFFYFDVYEVVGRGGGQGGASCAPQAVARCCPPSIPRGGLSVNYLCVEWVRRRLRLLRLP